MPVRSCSRYLWRQQGSILISILTTRMYPNYQGSGNSKSNGKHQIIGMPKYDSGSTQAVSQVLVTHTTSRSRNQLMDSALKKDIHKAVYTSPENIPPCPAGRNDGSQRILWTSTEGSLTKLTIDANSN